MATVQDQEKSAKMKELAETDLKVRTWQATSGLSQTQHDDITDELTAAAIHVAWTSGQLGGSAMVYDMDHSAARPPSCVLVHEQLEVFFKLYESKSHDA